MPDRVFLGTLRHIWRPGRIFSAPYHLCCLSTITRWLSYRHRTHRHPANYSRCSLSNPLQPWSRRSSSSYPLLACGPARVVCTDRFAVCHTEHHEPMDAVRLRHRCPLQRVRHGDPRSNPESTTRGRLFDAEGPTNQANYRF